MTQRTARPVTACVTQWSTRREVQLPGTPLKNIHFVEGCCNGLAQGLRSKEDEHRFSCVGSGVLRSVCGGQSALAIAVGVIVQSLILILQVRFVCRLLYWRFFCVLQIPVLLLYRCFL